MYFETKERIKWFFEDLWEMTKNVLIAFFIMAGIIFFSIFIPLKPILGIVLLFIFLIVIGMLFLRL